MPTPDLEPQLKHHLMVIQRRWWAIAIAAVLAFTTVWFWQTGDADRYEATSVVRISYSAPVADSGEIIDFQARSYAERAASPPVIAAALESSGLDIDVDEAESRLDVALRSTPGFVEIKGQGPTPAEAQLLVEAVSSTLVDLVNGEQPVAIAGEEPPSS